MNMSTLAVGSTPTIPLADPSNQNDHSTAQTGSTPIIPSAAQAKLQEFSAAHSSLPRVRRTPPPPAQTTTPPPFQIDKGHATFQALAKGGAIYNGLDYKNLGFNKGETGEGLCTGLLVYGMNEVTTGRSPDLMDATDRLRTRLGNPQTRESALGDVRRFQQEQAKFFYPEQDIPGRIRMPGTVGLGSPDELTRDLRNRFAGADAGGPQVDFARLSLRVNNAPNASHSILIERSNPSGNYLNDHYQIYDANFGVFDYGNFESMHSALTDYFHHAYPEYGGISMVHSVYYANPDQRQSEFGAHSLSDLDYGFGMMFGRSLTPPRADLPPLPAFDQPGPSGYQPPGHQTYRELKRDADSTADRQPFALYRPSDVAPSALKKQGGFSAERTRLRDINLDLHDFDVAANPLGTDSAGYLGTFRTTDVAIARLPAGPGNGSEKNATNGYIYYVAPSPNMVNVNASLGSHARAPQTQEVAAMGRIDYTQIRGWRQVANGKPGAYVANPDYRWDIYDQTRTAGAQPQLSHFPATDPAWADEIHRPFVTVNHRDGQTTYTSGQNPDLVNAEFYGHATDKIHYLADRQARGLDYRGPLQLNPANEGAYTHLYAFSDDYVYTGISASYGDEAKTSFIRGEDGRFHLADDFGKVLRVDGRGYVYVGDVPSDPYNRNGVFDYRNGHLIHDEDGKFLNAGGVVNKAVYVSATDQGSSSEWRALNDKGQPATLPGTNIHTFRGNTAGDQFQLYEFSQDPDAALPYGTTHFVTQVPGTHPPSGNNFLDYVNNIPAGDGANAATWLSEHHAAWFFRDGFYAMSTGPNQLEVRKLDGTPVWRIDINPATGKEDMQRLSESLSSNYCAPDTLWQWIGEQEAERRYVEQLQTEEYRM
ncbi:enterotoxin A family protein [Paraburkholderia sediminicola]|uniref:enterotoxin A family protein n=2 Tax=Paraburkholderia sediminicola TaxID=458836 RepID=UPI0038BA4A0F